MSSQKQHKEKPILASTYKQTKSVLQFLLEGALRKKQTELALILQETIECCDSIIAGKPSAMTPVDTYYALYFLKGFLELDSEEKTRVLKLLSLDCPSLLPK